MKCPTCDVKLIYDKRKGIEIEQCPDCHGVWIDPLEFERLIHKKVQDTGNSPRHPKRFTGQQKKALLWETRDTF